MAKRAPQSTGTRRVRSKSDATPTPESPEQTGEPIETAVSEDDVRMRAYHLYLERGATHGNDVNDWVEAEKELRVRRQS